MNQPLLPPVALRSLLLPLAAALLAGCDGFPFAYACTAELRSNLVVEVRDSETQRPAAYGTTGWAEHGTERTELTASDSVALFGNWAHEQAGDYRVWLRRPGYRTATAQTHVDEDACHVRTRILTVSLQREGSAVAEQPLRFSAGQHTNTWQASATVQVHQDTLVLTGRALAPCTDLEPVAYRTGGSLHVQLQPAAWPGVSCGARQLMQEFELRYRLPPGSTQLYLTTGWGVPPVLFDGVVQVL